MVIKTIKMKNDHKKVVRLIVIVLLLLTFSEGVLAQKKQFETIYLNDGSVLKGNITEQVTHDYLILKLRNGQEVTVFHEEILKIKYNQKAAKYYQKEKGFFHQATIGTSWKGSERYGGNQPYFSVETIHGYQFRHALRVGLGAGWDYHPDFHIVPVFVSVGGDIGKLKVVPTYFANAGYGMAWERNSSDIIEQDIYEEVEGGLMLHLGGGLKIKLSKTALIFNVGYKIQNVSTERSFFDWQGRISSINDTNRKFNRLTIAVGVVF